MKQSDYRLRKRLLARLWVPLSGVFLVGALLSVALAIHFGNLVHDRWLLDSAMTLATQLRESGGELSLNLSPAAIQMFEWDIVDRIYEEVTSADGKRLFGNAVLPAPPSDLVRDEPRYYDATVDGLPIRVVAIAVASPNDLAKLVTIQVAETKKKREALVREVLLLFGPMQAGILLIAAMFVWVAVTTSLSGLEAIASRLRDYEPGRVVALHYASNAPWEIKSLVMAINAMIGKISESRAAQQRFVANASHQLRTPLASLQVQTERALREDNPERHAEALVDVLKAITRMRHLTQQLLTLTRSDASAEGSIAMADLDLAELARSVLEGWADTAIQRDVDLGYDGPESGVVVHGEGQLLRELMSNLVDNAIRYGHCGGDVTLRVRQDPVTIFVDDDGPGIAPDERERVLSPFYRAPSAAGEGCGLGLTIAREIAARHGARLVITDHHPRGTRVEVIFDRGTSTSRAGVTEV